MRSRFIVCTALFILVLGLRPMSARADDAEPAEYRAVIDEALREYATRNYEEARSLFHRANELFPNARTQRGLGMAQFELRNYGESIRALTAALSARVRPLPDSLRAETEELLARAENFVAYIRLRTTPELARLRVDGVSVERTSQPIVLNVGDHELELSAPDHRPARRSLSVHGGERETLHVALERASAEPLAASPADEGGPRRWYRSAWLWTGVVVVIAGAALATGLVLARDPAAPRYYRGTSETIVTGR